MGRGPAHFLERPFLVSVVEQQDGQSDAFRKGEMPRLFSYSGAIHGLAGFTSRHSSRQAGQVISLAPWRDCRRIGSCDLL